MSFEKYPSIRVANLAIVLFCAQTTDVTDFSQLFDAHEIHAFNFLLKMILVTMKSLAEKFVTPCHIYSPQEIKSFKI